MALKALELQRYGHAEAGQWISWIADNLKTPKGESLFGEIIKFHTQAPL